MQQSIIIRAFITNRINYCNSLLYGMPDSQIQRLQKIQNITVRILTRFNNQYHTTLILKKLHWLPVRYD